MGSYLTNQIMFWNSQKVSDHSRAPLSVNYESIERKSRMANGTLRKYVVAKKRSWSTSWSMLPTLKSEIVDGGMTAIEMEEFYKNNLGPFTMTLRSGDGTKETVTVMISNFSKEIAKRGHTNDLWNVTVDLEEV